MATGSNRSYCSNSSTSPSSDSESSASVKRTRRQVRVITFKQWKSTYEREYQTLTWLRCKTDDLFSSPVDTLTCSVCQKFESHIQSLKNFSVAWKTSFSNHRASNIIDHEKSEQYKTAMNLEKIERAKANKQDMSSYSAQQTKQLICGGMIAQPLKDLIKVRGNHIINHQRHHRLVQS